MYSLVTTATLCLMRNCHGMKRAKFVSVRVVETWRVFIAPLNKVKTKSKPKIIRFFNTFEDHVNTFEAIGLSPKHFDGFPNIPRAFSKISEYYTSEDL